jgi:hypothetical protein
VARRQPGARLSEALPRRGRRLDAGPGVAHRHHPRLGPGHVLVGVVRAAGVVGGAEEHGPAAAVPGADVEAVARRRAVGRARAGGGQQPVIIRPPRLSCRNLRAGSASYRAGRAQPGRTPQRRSVFRHLNAGFWSMGEASGQLGRAARGPPPIPQVVRQRKVLPRGRLGGSGARLISSSYPKISKSFAYISRTSRAVALPS